MTKFRVTWLPTKQSKVVEAIDQEDAWDKAISFYRNDLIDLLRPSFALHPTEGLKPTFLKVNLGEHLRVEPVLQPIMQAWISDSMFSYQVNDQPIVSLTVIHPALTISPSFDYGILNSWVIPSISSGLISYFAVEFPESRAYNVTRLAVVVGG